MYGASDLFKRAISQPNRDLRIRVTIEGKVYSDTDIQSCSTEESILTSDDFKLGSATASTFELTLLNMDDSLSAKSFEGNEVHIETGAVLDKFSQPVEYVSMGYFVVEKGAKENSLIKLTGFDKMIYFEKPYVSSLAYPATLGQILQEVCDLAGVELESKTFLNHDYIVEEVPDLKNVTLRQAAEHISELACGYACINRKSKLEIVTFKETNISINSSNYYDMKLSEYEYGPIESIAIKENIFALNPSDQLLSNIRNMIKGFKFKPFTTTWQGNILSAPGDIINVTYKNGETYKSFIAKQKFTYSTGLKCEVATNAKTEIQSEYQTPGSITQKIEKAESRLRSKIEKTDEKITLEVEAIGEAIAALHVEATNVTISVQSLEGRVVTNEAQLIVQAGQIGLKVDQHDFNGATIGSLFNMSPFAIDIEAGKLNLKGYTTFNALATPGATIIDGRNLLTGSVRADVIQGGVLSLHENGWGNATIYSDNAGGYGNLIFSSGGYRFDPGGTVDFGNNPVTGLNIVVSFG